MNNKMLDPTHERRLLRKSFFRYLAPSVLSLIFGQIAPLVDALCISRSHGEEALSMMSVVSPVYYLYNVIAVLFGIGAGVFIAKEAGSGESRSSGRSFTRSFIYMSIATVVLSAAILIFIEPVMLFLRSTPDNISYVREYLTVLVIGGIFYVWNFAGNFILTDDQDPNLAMAGSTVASIVNIIIDVVGLFVLGLGVWVAAFGTVFGMFCSCLVYMLHFRKKNSLARFDFSPASPSGPTLPELIKPGISQGIMYILTAIQMLIGNYILVFSGGTGGLGNAAVIENLELVITILIAGASESIMPIAAAYEGEGNQCGMHMVRRSAMEFGYLSILPFFVFFMLFPNLLMLVFEVDNAYMVETLPTAVRISMVAYLFVMFSEIQQNYYASIDQEKTSAVAGIVQTVFQILSLILLPAITPENAPWIAPLIGALASCVYIIAFHKGLEGVFEMSYCDTIYMTGQTAHISDSASLTNRIISDTSSILTKEEQDSLDKGLLSPFLEALPAKGKVSASFTIIDRGSEKKTAILHYDQSRKHLDDQNDTEDKNVTEFCMMKRRMITL